MQSVFVAGTDTGVGKTYIALRLMNQVRQNGLTVAGFKPVASGCRQIDGRLVNEDALALQKASSVKLDYTLVNPYAFAPAIAPHIAAQLQGVSIELDKIVSQFEMLRRKVDVVIVEGAGGWLVPLNDVHSMQDVALALNLPVCLVVGLRLGCINHAILTAAAIRDTGLKTQSLVCNQITVDKMPYQNQVIQSITARAGVEQVVTQGFEA